MKKLISICLLLLTVFSMSSIGTMNVQILMEKLGGGGNRSAAAVQFEHTTPAQAEERIRAAIDDYLG